jgi:hypothetical protein
MGEDGEPETARRTRLHLLYAVVKWYAAKKLASWQGG